MAKTTMVFLPEIKKDDQLYGIISIPQWMYKSKYVRWMSYWHPFACIVYLCFFLHFAITKWEKLLMLDITLAVLCAGVMLCSLLVLDNEKSMLELKKFREQHFWNNNFLNKSEKLDFDRKVKISVFAHYVSWLTIIFVFTSVVTAPYFSQTIYNEEWSYSMQFIVKMSGYLFILFGYYSALAHEGFYAYTILHAYFQMNTLRAYLRHEFRQYEKIDSNEKIYSFRYQTLIKGALLRCIKQHKRVVTYGTKVINTYNRWMVLHYLLGATVFSLISYCLIFDSLNCEVALTFSIFHLLLGGMSYHLIGDLFSEGYGEFHNELLNVKWYSLNKTNRGLYYMFLMITQKKYEIELWPSLRINRHLMCKFVKLIYTVFTLVTSLKSKMNTIV